MYEEYDDKIATAQDNGAAINLGEAMRLLKRYDMLMPLDCELDPLKVRWLAGQEARERWQTQKDNGFYALAKWNDELPYVEWEDDVV